MSLTSYRAAPPRDDGWRVANGEWRMVFSRRWLLAIRHLLFALLGHEEEESVLCRPGDDLLSHVLKTEYHRR